MNFRWFSVQIMFQVNLVGVQKLVLNCLEKWSSRIKKEKRKRKEIANAIEISSHSVLIFWS